MSFMLLVGVLLMTKMHLNTRSEKRIVRVAKGSSARDVPIFYHCSN